MKREINKLIKVILKDIEEILNNNNVNKSILEQIEMKVVENKRLVLNKLLETKNIGTQNSFTLSDRKYKGIQKEGVEKIVSIIEEQCCYFETFFEAFGGTGVISNVFNNLSKTILINDILDANKCIYEAWFGVEQIDIENIKIHIDNLNKTEITIDTKENYFSNNYGDTFFRNKEAKKIWLIRSEIENLYNLKHINSREKNILITSLLYAADKISNTCGNYEAYSKNFKGINKLYLEYPDIKEENNKENKIYMENANELVEKIDVDIVYLDPPYTSRQYSEMYHLLDVIALGKELEVEGKIKKYKKRKEKRSRYCLKDAEKEFKDLIDKIKAEYIAVSYPKFLPELSKRSQPIISFEKIKEILNEKGEVTEKEIEKDRILIVNVRDYKFDKEVIYNTKNDKKLKWKKERNIQQLKSIILFMTYSAFRLDSTKDFKIIIDEESDIKDSFKSILSKKGIIYKNLEKYKFYDDLKELQNQNSIFKENSEVNLEMILNKIKITNNIENEIEKDKVNVILLNNKDKIENIDRLLENIKDNGDNIFFLKENREIEILLIEKKFEPIYSSFFEEHLDFMIEELDIKLKNSSPRNKIIILKTNIKE